MGQPSAPIDLKLTFAPGDDYATVGWESDDLGKRQSLFAPPYAGADLALVLRALDALQRPTAAFTAAEAERLTALGVPNLGGLVRDGAPRAVGRRLLAALTADPRARDALVALRNELKGSRPLQLRLHFPPEAVDLAALPWELLWAADEAQPLLLTLSQQVSCTRHLDLPVGLPPARTARKPLRILPVIAQGGRDEAERREEAERRAKAWAGLAADGDALLLDAVSPATVAALVEALQDEEPDIIHIVAHGHYADGQGYLMLDGEDGGQEAVAISRIATPLGRARLVTLLACQSAAVSGAPAPGEGADAAHSAAGVPGLLTGAAPAISAAGAPLVLAMQLSVRVKAAYQLAATFYRRVARGDSVQAALGKAREALFASEPDGASWFVPVLYVRSRERGEVFMLAEGAPGVAAAPPPGQAPRPVMSMEATRGGVISGSPMVRRGGADADMTMKADEKGRIEDSPMELDEGGG